MSGRHISDAERRAANRGTVYAPPRLEMTQRSVVAMGDKTPVTAVSPIQRRRDTRNLAKGIALGAIAALAGVAAAVLFGGCAPVPKASPKTPPKLGASLIFPGGGSGSGSGGGLTNTELRASPVPVSGTVTANQGTAAAGTGAWPVTVTNTANTVVKPGDAVNDAIRVNVVAGGAAGGTSSSFGAAVPATGTAAGASDGTNMQLPRVFDGDTGAGTQYVSGSILRKSASGGTVEAGTSTDPLRVDPTGSTTQPVSGTVAATQSGGWSVTANAGTNLNTSALVLESTFGRAQGSATAAQTGPLIQGAVTTGAPSYTTAQTSPFSLTTGGSLRVAITTSPVPTAEQGTPNVQGAAAHDATVSGNPLLMGGYASAAAPTDVSADADAVRAWFLRNGAQATQLTFAGGLAATGSGAVGATVQRVELTNNGTGIVNQGGTWTVQPGNTQNTTEWLTKPTPRTVTAANNTGTCTSVTTASTTVLASNASRKAYGFKAPSTNTVAIFCKLGATATTAAVPFEAGSSWSQDNGAVYTGVIDCITASSSSSICVYEFN